MIDIGSPLAALRVVRFEDFEDRVWTGQHPAVPDEFADTFYLTALRGHRPRTARHTPLTYHGRVDRDRRRTSGRGDAGARGRRSPPS